MTIRHFFSLSLRVFLFLLSSILLTQTVSAEPIYRATKWTPVAETLSDLQYSHLDPSHQYRLYLSYANEPGYNRYIYISEIVHYDSNNLRFYNLISSPLNLSDVSTLGDDFEEQQEIQNLLVNGTVLDFRYRVRIWFNGQAQLFLTSIVPGRPNAFGEWEITETTVVLEELKSAYPQFIPQQRDIALEESKELGIKEEESVR